MSLCRSFRPRVPGRAVSGLVATLAALSLGVLSAHAEVVRPWAPPGDSLLGVAATARVHFERQRGDSVGGDNYDPYEIVGRLGRRMLAALGRTHALQAPAIEATLDSLGLDVEVAIDPRVPGMTFMLVRNPYHRTSNAFGFTYWYHGNDLRMQGMSMPPAQGVTVRFWWTGRTDVPYEEALVYDHRSDPRTLGFRLLRLEPRAMYWNLVQYEGNGPMFEPRATASFVDVNQDGLPELLAFQPLDPDSFLVLRSEVPKVTQELLFTERPEGFVAHDSRTLAGPTETLRLFTRILADRRYDRAKLLLAKPATLDSMLARGWARKLVRGAFTAEYGEPGQAWPEWMELRILEDAGWKRWIFHFTIVDGRWVIRDWIPVQAAPPRREGAAPSDTTGTVGP